MQVKSFLSSALLLGVVALAPTINTQEVDAASSQKPYCTISSRKGGYWWTWTQSTRGQSCNTARSKVKGFGQNVNSQRSGFYKANGLNKGKLVCNQGTRNVTGSGSAVFENGINMATILKWNGCTFRVKN
ncbi:MAG: hypothetical protein AAF757_18250 [Cyanobacteria bacterium P01_D01_bin.116]